MLMIVYPAIDLKNGECVRLYQGDFSQKTVVNPDPIAQAIQFEKEGAKALHIVDLDGALSGDLTNFNVIKKIRQSISIPIQIGGGIRSLQQINQYLTIGIEKVIIGSKAVEDPEFVKEAVSQYGNQIIVGIDAKNGFVAINGWLDVSKESYLILAKSIASMGVKTVIFTDIAKDGTLAGPNLEQLKELIEEVPQLAVIASGGISNKKDLLDVKELGVAGAISGKALYNGNLTMTDLVEVSN